MYFAKIIPMLILLTSLNSLASSTIPGPDVNKVKQSIFLVRSTILNGGGTGFVTVLGDEPILVTNRHVCDIPTHGRLLRVSNETGKYIGTILGWSKDSDLCLISLPGNFSVADHPPLVVARVGASIGQIVHTVGYPRLLGPFYGAGSVVAYETGYDQTIAKWAMFAKASMLAQPGQSGSPMLDERGEVVGVLVAINNLYTFYVPLSDLRKMLGLDAVKDDQQPKRRWRF